MHDRRSSKIVGRAEAATEKVSDADHLHAPQGNVVRGAFTKPASNRSFCPRLSEARQLLPLIRRHLSAAASRRPLATALDLVPIVEDGLFGYELVPEREAHTYLIIGCNAQNEAVLRKTSYGVGDPDALQLATVNGHVLSRSERAARYSAQRRDSLFPNWLAAAESAWAQLLILFPDRPRQTRALSENVRGFEEALWIAHSYLVRWDPFIQFFGLPNEAQLGFALTGASGEHGALIFQPPDIWTLRWNAPPEVLYKAWSVVVGDLPAGNVMARGAPHFPDRRVHPRRAHSRRATDCGRSPDPWVGKDRRHTRGRRAMDQHYS